MLAKVITFQDIANDYSGLIYGPYNKTGKIKLVVISKYGVYTRIWDKNDNVIKTTFQSNAGFILLDDE